VANRNLTRYIVAGLAAAILLAALWPISSPATPLWKIWVVDESGHPVEGALVSLSWQNYSAEDEGHEQDLRTDQNGYVAFPPKTLEASVLRRMIQTIVSATAGVHASFGPHAYVDAFGADGLAGEAVSGKYVTDWTGAPPEMQSRIVLKPRPHLK
jgi:hypothetical protein